MAELMLENALLHIGPGEFRLFRELVHRHTGIWLRDGKEVMLASRLSRRLRELGIGNFADYYQYVERCNDGGRELGELINCVTTNKTAFFRERHHFDFLSEVLAVGRLPLAPSPQGAGSAETVSIWSGACSTGEEPYSIAVTLLESQARARSRGGGGWEIRIVASDIDTNVLQKAARGIYDAEALQAIEPVLHKKYFLRGKDAMVGQIRVKDAVRSLIEFKRINLMSRSWPLGTRFDAIFFRNALIYFKHETQDLFLRRMIGYLKPGGYLFLGHSEHIPWLNDLLEPLQQTVYRLRSGAE